MEKSATTEQKQQVFDPLNIMGIFWSIFGVIVLIATAFIQESKLTPILPGIVVNILAGSTLLAAGIICLWKAKSRRDKVRKEMNQ